MRTQIFTSASDVYHAFEDLSRRKPYICGICGRDIKHPYHQPELPGLRAIHKTVEPVIEEAPIPVRPAPAQMKLF